LSQKLGTSAQNWGREVAPDFDSKFGGIEATHSCIVKMTLLLVCCWILRVSHYLFLWTLNYSFNYPSTQTRLWCLVNKETGCR